MAQHQLDGMFSPAPSVALECSTKTGKTVAAIAWLVEEALRCAPGPVSWVAPTFSVARDIGWKRTVAALRDQPVLVGEPTISPLRIHLVNGASIHYESAENPRTLYGDDRKAALMDECGNMARFQEALAAVTSTLGNTAGRLRTCGNTFSGSEFREHCDRIESGAMQDWEICRWDWRQAVAAGFLRPEAVRRARQTLTAFRFQQLYENRPVLDASNPFGADCINACTTDERTPGGIEPEIDWTSETAGPVMAWGADVATTDAAGDWTVLIGLDAEGRVARLIRKRIRGPQVERLIRDTIGDAPGNMDATGVGRPIYQRFQDEGLWNVQGFTFTAASKQQLLYNLALALQSTGLHCPRGVIVDELGAFRVLLKRSEAGVVTQAWSAPPGRHDDCVCALALAAMILPHATAASFRVEAFTRN